MLAPTLWFDQQTMAVQIISGDQMEHFDWLFKCNCKDGGEKTAQFWQCCFYLSNQKSYFYKCRCYVLKGWIVSESFESQSHETDHSQDLSQYIS